MSRYIYFIILAKNGSCEISIEYQLKTISFQFYSLLFIIYLYKGINSVIRSIVLTLYFRYNVKQIIGYRYGFKGFNSKLSECIELTPDFVKGV
jgi:hypothetical protein